MIDIKYWWTLNVFCDKNSDNHFSYANQVKIVPN